MNQSVTTTPLISVIVPAHNAEPTLGLCLAALADQEAPPHEVIVVDDASTDATALVARRYNARVVRLAAQSGAAVARNAGAAQARAELLFFVDADVLVRPDTLARAIAVLAPSAPNSAVFGSYTATTPQQNFSSVYKNLVHHLTHQAARPEATTFWSGAGAVRAAAFWAVGGFDPADTRTADVEDIALGYRLTRAGFAIRLDRDLQVTHLKRYTFLGLIRSDVTHRAIPWTRLMLRERIVQRDLNTSGSGLLSAIITLLFVPTVVGALLRPPLALVAAGLLMAFLLLNRRVVVAFTQRYPRYLPQAVGMTALYYLYAAVGAAVGLVQHLRQPDGQRSPAHVSALRLPEPIIARGIEDRA